MNRFKISLAVLVLTLPMFATLAKAEVQSDRFEFGINAGVGFYVGQKNPLPGLQCVQTYDALAFGNRGDWGWPGIENFGFNVGYRFDTYWHVKLQTTRQRLCFAEFLDQSNRMSVYYNAMWHLDAMAEYNILPFGMNEERTGFIKNIVPYIGFGIGMTMYNENASLRAIEKNHANPDRVDYDFYGPMFPRVGYQTKTFDADDKKVTEWTKNPVKVAAYIPVSVGVKMRLNENVQLKGTFQYNFYPKANIEGYTDYTTANKENVKVGIAHNSLFSISAIFNFGRWYEDRLITY